MAFRTFVSLLFILCSSSVFSQVEIWGTTPTGGTTGNGTIFSYNSGAFTSHYSFGSIHPGESPWHVKLAEVNGKLYGMTQSGGSYNSGVLFEYDIATKAYAVFHNFQDGFPYGSLLLASNGKLYGCAGSVLFEFDPSTKVFQNIHTFTIAGGYSPGHILIEGDNSKLLGVTGLGGTNSQGVLFEFDLITKAYTVKVNFGGSGQGRDPRGGLMRASNGKYYGMTRYGGITDEGTIFEYDHATNLFVTKKSFGIVSGNIVEGRNPVGVMVQHPNGKLYGVTPRGGSFGAGVLFEYDIATNEVKRKREMFNPNLGLGNGSSPVNSLMVASNGLLYGMTKGNEIYFTFEGEYFQFDVTNDQYKRLSNCPSTRGTLMEASDGMFYVISEQSGFNSKGELLRVNPATNSIESLLSFDDSPDGANPYGQLTQAYNGKFYGMSKVGGTIKNYGLIFEFDPATKVYTKKIDFDGVALQYPQTSFTPHPNGKLYGVITTGGEERGYGAIIEYDPATNVITNISDFYSAYENDQTDEISGSSPIGDLVLAPNGKMYGTASDGGQHRRGTLYEYDPITHIIIKKFDFSDSFGSKPIAGLTLALNNKLYGVTSEGGANNFGTLFEYDFVTNVAKKKKDFAIDHGVRPAMAMIAVGNLLYGTCRLGGQQGANAAGTIYRYNTSTEALDNIWNFNIPLLPSQPETRLIRLSNGKLLGTSFVGGATNMGTIFQYDPAAGGSVTVLHSFTGVHGRNPEFSTLTTKRKNQTVTLNTTTLSKTYGDAPVGLALAASASSALPVSYWSSDTRVAEVVNGTIVIKGAGSVKIIAAQLGNDEFLPAPQKEIQLTVAKAALTAKASSATKKYGETNPVIVPVYQGFVGSDNASVIDTPPVGETTAGQFSDVGEYPLTLTGGSDNSYTITIIESAKLTIEKASLAFIAKNYSRKYKEPNPALEMLFDGFVGSDNSSVVDNLPAISTTATTDSDAGEYSITLTGGSDNNYAFTLSHGKLTVEKVSLQVTAKSYSRKYKEPNPGFEMTFDGFAGGESPGVLNELPAISCEATFESNVGSYPIVLSGGTDNNYTFTAINGSLEIIKAEQSIAFAALDDRTVGDEPIELSAESTSGLPVSFASSNTVIAIVEGNELVIKSAGTVDITASQSGNSNYSAATNVIRSLKVKELVTSVASEKYSELYAYPIPTSGKLYLDNARIGETIRVMNLIGNISTNASIDSDNSIDLSALPAGVYLLRYRKEIVRVEKF